MLGRLKRRGVRCGTSQPDTNSPPPKYGGHISKIMDINITLDLPKIIAEACSAERIQPIIDKAISEAIKSAIDNATGYRSDFRKALEAQLAEAMPHGLGVDDVAKFQHVLNAALTSAVQGENASSINAALAKAATAAMPDVPESIKLSELLDAAREGFHKEPHEAFYAHFEPSEHGGSGGWLYLDSDERPGGTTYGRSHESASDRKYRADIRLAINGDGEVYSLKLDGVDVMPSKAVNAVGYFEGLLLSMYVGRTKIEIDIDADDVESAAAAQED